MEVRFNLVLCNAITDRGVQTMAGREAAFRRRDDISFPDGSAAIKGIWHKVDLQNNDLPKDPACDIGSFHRYKVNDHTVNVLLAFHLSFKHPTTPNWFWATWEHKCVSKMPGYSDSGMCCRDQFGRGRDGSPSDSLKKLVSKMGAADEWLSYHLVGTQSDYQKDGLQVILRNYVIESGVPVSSSCMTCHSRATTDHLHRSLGLFADSQSNPISLNGKPQQFWYTDAHFTRWFVRLGFVWTLDSYSVGGNDPPEP
jgi:hypothetical protein